MAPVADPAAACACVPCQIDRTGARSFRSIDGVSFAAMPADPIQQAHTRVWAGRGAEQLPANDAWVSPCRPRARPHHFPHTGRPIANGPSSALLASPSAHGSLTRARARARAPRLTPHTHTLAAGTIGWQEVILTILYSIAGLGIAIVNDFKSIEGDRELGNAPEPRTVHRSPCAFRAP